MLRQKDSSSGAVWVVVQYDQCDLTDCILQPGYWRKQHAEKRAKRLNARETDSFTYRVKKIEMHYSPNQQFAKFKKPSSGLTTEPTTDGAPHR